MQIITFIFEILFSIIGSILSGLVWLLETLFNIKSEEKGYTAKLGTESDVLSIFNKGFCLTGKRSLTIKQSFQNALIVGATGTGKSANVILPTILKAEPKQSYIITDPSGELREKSAGYLKSKGFQILTLNFSDPDASEGYNPLSAIRSTQDIQKIAEMLVRNSLGAKQSGDPFWTLQSISLLQILIGILREQMPEYLNLSNIRYLLNAISGDKSQVLDQLFSRTEDEILFSEYKAFLAYDEKVSSGIIATCKAATNIFSNPAVARITSSDTLNLQSLRETPTALFIQTSVPDQRYFSILNALFFEQMFSLFMRKIPQKNELSILMLVDEAMVLGHLPTLSTALSNLRKYRVGGLYAVQSIAQIFNHYGQHDTEALKGNCLAKLFLGGGGQPLQTYEELERTIGKIEYYENEEKQTGKAVRPLIPAESIRLMDTSEGLLILGHQSGIKIKFHPYFKNYTLRKRSEMPAPWPLSKLSTAPVPLIPLETLTLPQNEKDQTD